jgi:hypothetical protein
LRRYPKGAKKSKKDGKVKDNGMPKRPRTAYLLFAEVGPKP